MKQAKHFFPNPSTEKLCLTHGKLIKLKKGAILFDEHSTNKTHYIYYLAEGICSVSGISYQGREQIFLYQKAGDMLGHVPYLMSSETQPHPYAYRRPTILAKTHCVLYEIPQKFFVVHLRKNLEFSIYLNEILARNYSMALAHLKQMQEDSVVSSVCRFLLQVASPSDKGLIIPKLFTYGEIARFLGVHEVTVSKIIGRLKQEALVTRISSGLLISNTKEL